MPPSPRSISKRRMVVTKAGRSITWDLPVNESRGMFDDMFEPVSTLWSFHWRAIFNLCFLLASLLSLCEDSRTLHQGVMPLSASWSNHIKKIKNEKSMKSHIICIFLIGLMLFVCMRFRDLSSLSKPMGDDVAGLDPVRPGDPTAAGCGRSGFHGPSPELIPEPHMTCSIIVISL